MQIKELSETNLSANQKKSDMKKFNWRVVGDTDSGLTPLKGGPVDSQALVVELGPMEIRTFLLKFWITDMQLHSWYIHRTRIHRSNLLHFLLPVSNFVPHLWSRTQFRGSTSGWPIESLSSISGPFCMSVTLWCKCYILTSTAYQYQICNWYWATFLVLGRSPGAKTICWWYKMGRHAKDSKNTFQILQEAYGAWDSDPIPLATHYCKNNS